MSAALIEQQYFICNFDCVEVSSTHLFNKEIETLYLLGTFTDLDGNAMNIGDGSTVAKGVGNPGLGNHLVLMSECPRRIVQVLERSAHHFPLEVIAQ